jgi:hypothetical protein
MGIIIRHIYEAISTLPGNISPACSRACRKRQSQPGLLRPYRCPSSLPSMRHRQGEQSSWPLTKNSLLQLFHSTVKGQIQQLSIKGGLPGLRSSQHSMWPQDCQRKLVSGRSQQQSSRTQASPGPAWSRLTCHLTALGTHSSAGPACVHRQEKIHLAHSTQPQERG